MRWLIHCGTTGLANLKKDHCGMKTCLKVEAKYHEEEKLTYFLVQSTMSCIGDTPTKLGM